MFLNGSIAFAHEDYQQAIPILQASVPPTGELGGHVDLADALIYLSLACTATRDWALAVSSLREALTRLKRRGSEVWLGEAIATAGVLAAGQRHTRGILKLTEREYEIMRLLVDGKTTPRIASELFISRGTVRTHLDHIFGKLGVHSRSEAISICVRAGLN